MRVKSLLVILLLFSSILASAQDGVKVKFRTRSLFDVAYSDLDPYGDRVYPYFNDVRVGAKLSQANKSFKFDIGLSGSGISIKDMLFSLDLGDSYFTLGNSYEPFSIDMITSSVDLRFNNSASSSQAISTGRVMGLTYYLMPKHYFGAFGLYSDNSVSNFFDPSKTSTGIAFTTRQLYRNYSGGNLLQFGAALSYRTPNGDERQDSYREFTISAYGNDEVNANPIVAATVNNVKNTLKSNLEFLAIVNSFMVQTEFLHTNISRLGADKSYAAYGGYLQLSYLLGKGSYGYDYALAVPTKPSAKSLELVARVDYLDADCEHSSIYGGEITSYSMGLNYFLTSNVALKFNLNYIQSISDSDLSHFSTVMRLQFTF